MHKNGVVKAAKRAGRIISSDSYSASMRDYVKRELRTLQTAVENTQTGRWTEIRTRSESAPTSKKK